jgi:hypothetical protein
MFAQRRNQFTPRLAAISLIIILAKPRLERAGDFGVSSSSGAMQIFLAVVAAAVQSLRLQRGQH